MCYNFILAYSNGISQYPLYNYRHHQNLHTSPQNITPSLIPYYMKLKAKGIGTAIYPINKTKALKYPESIEDEAHFLLQCTEDSDIKTDIAQQIAMEIAQFSYITEKILPYYPAYKSPCL